MLARLSKLNEHQKNVRIFVGKSPMLMGDPGTKQKHVIE